ncbi:SdpI family protein, partial [Myxococcota bacterium]|nr:SdpI family protein [Myxococcota bacterium]
MSGPVDTEPSDPADASGPTNGAPSTVLTRVALPLGIIWTGVLSSAFVFSRLPEGVTVDPARGAATFGGVPVLSVLALVGLRLARRGVGAGRGRGEDLVVAWVMTFLLGVHCLVLALSIGIIDALERALPIATGLLFIGLGPVLATLEHQSAMGIRTAATLASPAAWRRTHHIAGYAFPLAGIASFTGAFVGAPWALVAALA